MDQSEPEPHFRYLGIGDSLPIGQQDGCSVNDVLGQIDFAILASSAEILGYSHRAEGESSSFVAFMRRCLPLVIQCCTDTLNSIQRTQGGTA
jgi:hypothetical protein